MRRWAGLVAAGVGASVLVVAAPHSSGYPRPGTTTRVSLSSAGKQGNGQSGGVGAWNTPQLAMTPDARFVAFKSTASNLVAGDTNGAQDIFVRDRSTGRTERVSVASDGHQGEVNALLPTLCPRDEGAEAPAISADGRYVAFHSCFANLVPLGPTWLGDTNAMADVFVHDRRTRETTRVSVSSKGVQGDFGSWFPTLSADGRFVTFESQATTFGTDDSCESAVAGLPMCPLSALRRRVYVHDRKLGTTTAVPLVGGAVLSAEQAYQATISSDGRYVSFISDTGTLGQHSLYLYDRTSRGLELISRGPDGTPITAFWGGTSRTQVMSADNRYVVYEGRGEQAVPDGGDRRHSINPGPQVLVYDRKTRRTERVSVDSAGGGLFNSVFAAISRDGRYVAYQTGDSSYTGAPTAIAVHDRLTGATDWVPMGKSCRESGKCARAAAISADGRYVAFGSEDDGLVRGDTNGQWDVFVRDRGRALAVGGLSGSGAPATSNLLGASLVYRPDRGDALVRIELRQWRPLSPVVHALDFAAGGRRYQVRAAQLGAFSWCGLFRDDDGRWTQRTNLDCGFGTTGSRIVVALPLRLAGVDHGDELTGVRAVTGPGSYATGPVGAVEELPLREPLR